MAHSRHRPVALHPALGGVQLQKLTPVHLNMFYADLVKGGRCDGKGGLSARSVRYSHTIIRRALADAMKWGRIARNVADAADPPKASAARRDAQQARRFWSPEELSAFLAYARPHGVLRGAVPLSQHRYAPGRGARAALARPRPRQPGRSTAVGVTDCRRARPANRVLDPEDRPRPRRLTRPGDRGRVAPAQGAAGRVPARARQGLRRPRPGLLRGRRPAGTAGQPQPSLSPAGQSVGLAAGSAARPPAHPREFGAQGDVHPKIVQTRLGHASIGITMDTYSHVTPGQDLDAARLVALLVAGSAPAE
jgi:hypothetical protein